jgi:hypothetical protein
MNDDDVLDLFNPHNNAPRITILGRNTLQFQYRYHGIEEFNRYQEPIQPKYNIKKHLLLDNQVVANSYYSNK